MPHRANRREKSVFRIYKQSNYGRGYNHACRAVPCSEPPKLDFARFGEPHALPPFVFRVVGDVDPYRLVWVIIMLVGRCLGAAVCVHAASLRRPHIKIGCGQSPQEYTLYLAPRRQRNAVFKR